MNQGMTGWTKRRKRFHSILPPDDSSFGWRFVDRLMMVHLNNVTTKTITRLFPTACSTFDEARCFITEIVLQLLDQSLTPLSCLLPGFHQPSFKEQSLKLFPFILA